MSTEMKKLIIGGTEYEIVDDAGRARITALEQGGGTGLTQTEKNLLLTLFEKAAYAENDAGTAYAALSNLWTGYSVTWSGTGYTKSNSAASVTAGATFTSSVTANTGFTITNVVATMGGETVQGAWSSGTVTIPNVTGDIVITVTTAQAAVSSISAVYTQSGTVYDTASLDSLKSDLVVTATFTDSSTGVIAAADYTLSGTLAEGTSTITVSYAGKTATFNVTITHYEAPALYDWDFTDSLTDRVSGATAALTGCTQDSTGVHFAANNQAIQLLPDTANITGKTFIFDIPSYTGTASGNYHGRFFMSSASGNNTQTSGAGFVYRSGNGWTVYSGSAWGTSLDTTTYPLDFFSGKRMKLYIDTDGKIKISYADIGSDSYTEIGTFSTAIETSLFTGYWIIGGTGNNNLKPMTISAVKVYEGEV